MSAPTHAATEVLEQAIADNDFASMRSTLDGIEDTRGIDPSIVHDANALWELDQMSRAVHEPDSWPPKTKTLRKLAMSRYAYAHAELQRRRGYYKLRLEHADDCWHMIVRVLHAVWLRAKTRH